MLKQLIQRLLDSRTTPEEAGHSAMPSASETVLLTQNDAFQSWGNIHQGVAADDGYVNIFARSVNNTTSEMRVLTSGMTFSSAQTVAEKDMACSAPVAKGQTYTIKGVQVKGIKIIFVKTLGQSGGGYNRIVWRAQLCLRALSNYLPKVSSRANPSGSAAKHIHQGVSHSQALSRNTSLPQTVFWGFTKIKRPRVIVSTFIRSDQRAKSSQEQLLHSLLPQISLLSQLSYLLRRAIGLLLRVPSMSFGSHQQWGANTNLRTGGALC